MTLAPHRGELPLGLGTPQSAPEKTEAPTDHSPADDQSARARGLFARFLAAIDKSRRWRAEREIRRYQHLIDKGVAYHARHEAEVQRRHRAPQSRSPAPVGHER